MATAPPLEKPLAGSWQLEQLSVRSFDRRGSKKSRRPSATFSGVDGLLSGDFTACRPSGISVVAGSAAKRAAMRPARSKHEKNIDVLRTARLPNFDRDAMRQKGQKGVRNLLCEA